MSKHTLSLADLNAAAPDVLSVVFGPDGEFLLAPMFRPPLWHADPFFTDEQGAPLVGPNHPVGRCQRMEGKR